MNDAWMNAPYVMKISRATVMVAGVLTGAEKGASIVVAVFLLPLLPLLLAVLVAILNGKLKENA
jgi:hypothetical protein